MQARRNRPRGRCRKDRNRDTHKGADAKRLVGRGKNRRMPVFLRQSFFAAISNPHHGLQALSQELSQPCPSPARYSSQAIRALSSSSSRQ